MSEQTLNSLIESLARLKLSKKTLEKEITDVEGQIEGVEKQLFDVMDKQGLTSASSPIGEVVAGESQYPHVENWPLFEAWVLDNKYLHMYQKRLSVTAYRELLNLNRPIPGVVPFTKRKLTFKES